MGFRMSISVGTRGSQDDAGQMEKFRQCWKIQGNDKRTDTKDVDKK